jgi:hypothetical protein
VGEGTHPPDAGTDNGRPQAFQFHLIVHVFGGNGVVLSADGVTSNHAFVEHEFASADELPQFVVLPLFANGVLLSLSTDGCQQPGLTLAYEHMVVSSLEGGVPSFVFGSVARDCTFLDGTTKALAPVSITFDGTPIGTQL